jgi:tRNA pseudouridine55 synthase
VPPLGLLNLNKPSGMTSRDAVDCVQRVAGRIKAGHAGTLDPLASGVLVVCVGAATRLIEYVQRMAKHYAATFLLGRQSPTEDIEGGVSELENPPVPTLSQITAAAATLTGPIRQRPPAFSAIKVAGRRAYELARRGKPVELEPRTVMVHRLEVESYNYPELKLRVECGSGTYVRSLGRDLAESLGTAAVMSELVRTAVGSFRLAEAIDPLALSRENWTECLLPPLQAVEMLPRITLDAAEVDQVRSGQAIERSGFRVQGSGFRGERPQVEIAERTGSEGPEPRTPNPEPSSPVSLLGEPPAEIAALDVAGRLAAILTPRGPGLWGPVHNLPEAGN